MEYKVDAIDVGRGLFSGFHEKAASEFQKLIEKRSKDGWELHSFDSQVVGNKFVIIAYFKK